MIFVLYNSFYFRSDLSGWEGKLFSMETFVFDLALHCAIRYIKLNRKNDG
jgi:hypothetical protein